MTPKELFASKAKHAEEEAERVRKMTPDEKAASKAKHAEQEAERVRKMLPLGPFAEIRGASSAMQALAGVCAAMVASTLLQHTALRGIIESERMYRSYRVWYKNRYLVS